MNNKDERVYIIINGIELECDMDLENDLGHVPCLILEGGLKGYELLLDAEYIRTNGWED